MYIISIYLENEELVIGLYKITYHFDLDKLIY